MHGHCVHVRAPHLFHLPGDVVLSKLREMAAINFSAAQHVLFHIFACEVIPGCSS